MKKNFDLNLSKSLKIACEYGNLEVASLLVDYISNELLKLKDYKENIYHLIAKNKHDPNNKIESIFNKVKEKLEDPNREILSEMDKKTDLNVLHMTILNRHLGIIRILLSNPEDFECVNKEGGIDKDWPLHFVAKSGSIECLEILKTEHFEDDLLGKLNKNFENIFHTAIAHKNNAFIRYLLKQKEIRNHVENLLVNKNNLMATPLEYAVFLGNLEAARQIEVWTDLKQVDFKCGHRSLFYVCVENGHLDSIYYLFSLLDRKYGLDSQGRDVFLSEAISLAYEPEENTVFHLAAQKSNFEIIKYLIDKCPFVFDDILFLKNRQETSCFHLCCIKGIQIYFYNSDYFLFNGKIEIFFKVMKNLLDFYYKRLLIINSRFY